MNPLLLLLTAVQFYTRIPVPRWVGHSDAQLAAATPYFPLVGMLIGLVVGIVFDLARTGFGPLVAAVVAVGFGVLLTGAFHEDGFADVCDGFGGGYTKERVLEIMKDSRVGAFGAIGIGLLLLLQVAALAETPAGHWPVVLLLIATHALSRALALAVALWLPYVQEDAVSKAKPVVTRFSRRSIAAALVLGALPLLACAFWLSWQQAVVACLLAFFGLAYCIKLFGNKIGGYTGDCLGAAQQVAFTALLLGFAYRG